jgi:Transmembrane domain of unknown function (DUF3566)
LDRRTNTSDGSGGATPTVVTAQHDGDDLMTEGDRPTEIRDDAETETVPALPADSIGGTRDSSSFPFSRSAAAPVSPGADDWTPGDSPAGAGNDENVAPSADSPPPGDASAPADIDWSRGPGTSSDADLSGDGSWTHVASWSQSVGWSGDSGAPGDVGPSSDRDDGPSFDAGRSGGKPSPSGGKASWPGESAGVPAAASPASSSAATPSSPEPEAVSAAAFVWEKPEPAPTSPSSPVRNFLRSTAAGKDPAPPRTPAATVGSAKTTVMPPVGAPAGASAAGASAGLSRASSTGPGRASSPAPGAAGKRPKGKSKRSTRQAHLIVARIEPWSVMKFSFVVSLVSFVILFVAVTVLYGTLSALGVFTSLEHVVSSLTSSQDSAGVNASRWFTASRILGYTALLGSINIVLITAMSTIGAVIYNLTSRLIGGVEVTLRETD